MSIGSKAGVIALVQARGGSKGVPGKNVRLLGGYPVLAWSIAACRLSKKIERTILSTDSEEIAGIGRRFGAEVPFLRPAEYATDAATDFVVFKHALEWLRDKERHIPDFVVQIRPTTPFRDPEVIDAAISALRARPDATGLRSVFEMPESAWKTFEMEQNGYLTGIINRVRIVGAEASNLPRQAFPPTYFGQGYVDIVRPQVVLESNQTYGERVLGYLTPDVGEIDTADDFKRLESTVAEFGGSLLQFLRKIDSEHTGGGSVSSSS